MKSQLLTILSILMVGSFSIRTIADEPPPFPVASFDAIRAKTFQKKWADYFGKKSVHTNSIGMKMVLIPPGEFLRGTTQQSYDQPT